MAKQKLNPFKVLNSRRLLVVVVSLIVFFCAVNYVLLPMYVKSGATLSVPNVVGLPAAQARRMLDSIGLQPIEAETKPDPKAPVGTVVLQNPVQDALVKKGRNIYLTLSGGEVLVSVPKVRGLSMRDSRFSLERSGLLLGEVNYDTSRVYPENTTIAQSVPPGNKAPRGTKVNIVVSQGKGLLDIEVPNLMGKTLTECERILTERGLKVGVITYHSSFDLLPNTIVDQFPRGGESALMGQAVDLFVVKTGKPKEEIQSPEH